MMRFWNGFNQNKEGAFAILYVIVIFVGVLFAVGFVEVLTRSYVMDEVQSEMDVAGVASLYAGVDEEKLRIEFNNSPENSNEDAVDFDIDKGAVTAKYESLLKDHLNKSTKIKDYEFISTDVDVYDYNTNSDKYASKFGLGITNKARPQAFIDSTIGIKVDSSQMFDLIPNAYKNYYDSRNNASFSVTYAGKDEDGQVELIVRSVSRIVYR